MQQPSFARLAASIAGGFATLALTATIAAAQGSPTPPTSTAPAKTAAGSIAPAACTLKFAVDSVPSSPTPLVLNAALSAAIGDSVAATFPSESGITASVGPAATGGASALQLTLNTSAAKPGEWPVALKGKTGDCSGKLKVVAGGK
jgi:hypothetical protein